MANIQLEDTILKAIDIITQKRIASAGYDKTIQATIISCVDQTIGKYKVKYQDSIFYAYGSNIGGRYSQGQSVFILIPNGDMKNDKTILGATKKLGTNYVTIMQDSELYAPIGKNIILTDSNFGLCSYLNPNDVKVLYSKEYSEDLNLIHLDLNGVNEYIKSSSYITIGGQIQTNLDVQQQHSGNYGILIGLDFKNNSVSDEIITKYYVLDADRMTGNPYRFINKTKQYETFEIDPNNFIGINTISIFSENFPKQASNKPNDIFISNLEVCGAAALSQEDLNSYALVLLTPKGYIFNSENLNTDIRTVQAQLRIKGKVLNLESQKVQFYWFTENIAVTSKNPRYSPYGGQGWECLNPYRTLVAATTTNIQVREYLPSKNSFSVTKEQILTEKVRYKCVAIYDGNVLSKEINIINLDCQYRFYILSDSGTQFHYDIGHPTLTCICEQKVNSEYESMPIDNMSFVWAKTNNIGNFESLPYTDSINIEDLKLKSLYNNTKSLIDAQWILPQQIYNGNDFFPSNSTINAKYTLTEERTRVSNILSQLRNDGFTSATDINNFLNSKNIEYQNISYSTLLYNLNILMRNTTNIQKVYKNKIIDLNIKTITRFASYKCSIFTTTGNHYLGTASITISNLLEGEGFFSLVINNGSQVFKYNTHGVSPASKQNKIPLQIPALSFSIFDGKGEKIDDDIIKHCEITWTVPVQNTMLKIDQAYEGQLNGLMTEKSYKNLMSFVYQINEKFDISKMNNTIQLKVNYQGLTLVAHTNLTFTKEGLSGTNGTDFTCKIVPNAIEGNIPEIPTLYYGNNGVQLNWRTDTNNNQWFKVQLWHNGIEPIFSNNVSGISTQGKTVTIIKWEVLKNKYSGEIQDRSNLEVTNILDGSFNFNVGSYNSSWNQSTYTTSWLPANIIKVTLSYDGFTYYATLPLVIVRYFSNSYRVGLKPGTGFQEVLYTSAGIQPTFNNRVPFEILLQQALGSGNYAEIGSKTTSAYNLQFNWFCLGVIRERNFSNWSFVYNDDRKWIMPYRYSTIELAQNQFLAKPADTFDGQCVTTAIGCQIVRNGSTIAWIHIPIHMSRNRFFNSAINGWDGNSVELGGENGGTILAPQVGAGYKDANNTFTGIFMGTAKDPKESVSSEIDNTSNNSQGRFAAAGEDVGIFGYAQGQRSIFLDAKTGKAVFGVKNKSQIILDPSTNEAIIKSGNYEYDPYGTDGDKGHGMQINLTEPSITYGNGNLKIDENGHLTARGGGQIAGWKIADFRLYSNSGNTGMSSATGSGEGETNSDIKAVTVPVTTLQNTENYTDEQGETHSIWQATVTNATKSAAFWAQHPGGRGCFITHDGYLKATTAFIGNSNPIYMGQTYQATDDPTHSRNLAAIFSNRKASINANRTGFYLGEDGLGIGPRAVVVTSQDEKNNDVETKISAFYVDANTGNFYAKKGYIGTRSKGWTIEPGRMYNQSVGSIGWGQPGFYMSPQYGISIASLRTDSENDDTIDITFSVNRLGVLTSKKAYIANWQMRENLLATSMVINNKVQYPNIGQGNYDASATTNKVTITTAQSSSPTNVAISNLGIRVGKGFLVSANPGTGKAAVYLKDAYLEGKINVSGAKIGDWRFAGDSFIYNPDKGVDPSPSVAENDFLSEDNIDTDRDSTHVPIAFHGKVNTQTPIALIGDIHIGKSASSESYRHPTGLMWAGTNRSRDDPSGVSYPVPNLWWEFSGDDSDGKVNFLRYGLQIMQRGLTIRHGGITVDNGGVKITKGGLTVSDGGATITKGGLTVSAGNVTVSTGSVTVTAGGISAKQDITTQGKVSGTYFSIGERSNFNSTNFWISGLQDVTNLDSTSDDRNMKILATRNSRDFYLLTFPQLLTLLKKHLAEKGSSGSSSSSSGGSSSSSGDDIGSGTTVPDEDSFTVTLSSYSFTYTGSQLRPTVYVNDSSTNDPVGSDWYTVNWPSDTTNVGTKRIGVVGHGNQYGNCYREVTYEIVAASGGSTGGDTPTPTHTYSVTITLNQINYDYTGSSITPDVTVKGYVDNEQDKTFSSSEYTLNYSPSDHTSVGNVQVSATITASGNYKNKQTSSVSFNIKEPEQTTKVKFEAEWRQSGHKQTSKYTSAEMVEMDIIIKDKNGSSVDYSATNGYYITNFWRSSFDIVPRGSKYTSMHITTKVAYDILGADDFGSSRIWTE